MPPNSPRNRGRSPVTNGNTTNHHEAKQSHRDGGNDSQENDVRNRQVVINNNMNSREICRNKTALILVDMSIEQVADLTYKKDEVIQNCQKLLSFNTATIFDLLIDSRLWLTAPEESSLSTVYPETGRTLFVAGSSGAKLIPELQKFNNNKNNLQFVKKNNYSCFANSELNNILKENSITDVYIAGINTDYCIFATTLDSFQYHFNTFVIRDAITSVRGKHAHEEGIRNLQRHFGTNILIKTEHVLSSVKY